MTCNIKKEINAWHNRRLLKFSPALLLTLSATACQNLDTQDNYSTADVGREITVEFGNIIAIRPVTVKNAPSGGGLAAGAIAGGLGGSAIGGGSGRVVASIIGAVAGAAAGNALEGSALDDRGLEYTITKQNGQTVIIVQNYNPDDRVLHPGQRVVIQTSATYKRVLAADEMPDSVSRPRSIQVQD